MKKLTLMAAGTMTIALAGCGTQTAPGGDPSASTGPPANASPVIDAGGELVAHDTLMQAAPAG